jgi:hypothetical protein
MLRGATLESSGRWLVTLAYQTESKSEARARPGHAGQKEVTMKTYVMTDREKQAIKNVLFFAYRNAPGNQKTDDQIRADVECDIMQIIKNRRAHANKHAKYVKDLVAAFIAELPDTVKSLECYTVEDADALHFEIGFTLPNIRLR